jgi:branched-subunit amino acid ABC-type transport system permease component
MFFAQIALNSLVSGTHVLFLATALFLVHTVTRTLHPAVGAISVAGGYGYYFLFQMGAPGWLGIVGGITACVALQLASFLLFERFFGEDKRFIALLGSLAFGTALESVLSIAFGSSPQFLTNDVLPTFELFGLRLTVVGIWTIIVGIGVALLSLVILRMSPYGRVLRAIADHRETAESIGIRNRRVQFSAFVVAGIICGAVGIFKGFQETVSPISGLLPTVTAFFAVILGGMNDFRGTVVASYLLALVPSLLISFEYAGKNISSSWSLVIVFVFSLMLLMLRPRGIFASSPRNS